MDCSCHLRVPLMSIVKPNERFIMTTFIGIDWADKKHDICALSPKGEILAEFIVADTLKGFEQLHTFLKSQDQVEILIEKPNGLIVEFLLQRGWCVRVIT